MTENQIVIYWAAVACGKIDSSQLDEFTENYVDSLMDWWNPLYNNEDAFELAIDMKLRIKFEENYCCAEFDSPNPLDGIIEQFDPEGLIDNRQLARYAIVMAAAKIGLEVQNDFEKR